MKILEINGESLKIRISPSFLTNAACAAYLKFHYVDKIEKKSPRVPAERGKVMHEAIADLVRECHESDEKICDITDARLLEALEENMTHDAMPEIANMVSWLKKWRDNYVLPGNIYGIEEMIALDEEFDETSWETGSYRGIIDLLEVKGSEATVTDWKSQANILNAQELQENEQLTIYSWLLWKMYPHLKTFKVRIWYLRHGFYHETVRTEEQLIEYEQVLMLKEKRIENIENWSPTPGSHCGYCDYKYDCDLAQDLSPLNENIITEEQAIQAASRITAMEAMLKAMKGKLRDYVKANDAVAIGDWVYGYRLQSSRKFEMSVVESILDKFDIEEEFGEMAREAFNSDSRKITKLLKAIDRVCPDAASEIEESAIVKHGSRFSGYKRGKVGDDDFEEEEG